MRISDWSSDVCSSDLLARRDPVMLHIFPQYLPIADQYARFAFQQPLRPGKAIAQPAEDQRPEGKGADRQRCAREAEIIVGNALLDQIGRASCRERWCQYG